MMEDVTSDPTGEVFFPDAVKQHDEMLSALDAGSRRIVEALTGVGAEIVRLDASATPVPQSQHIRFRVQYLIISRATVGDMTLQIGTGTYPFTVGATPERVDFPIVIERGVDMSAIGDGRLYLVGFPE